MLVNVLSAKCVGIDAVPINVEVDIIPGIGIHMVGLADTAVKESLLRTMTALQALNYKVPGKKIVINLAPADLQKSGSAYDLPIAIGIIAASEQRKLVNVEKFLILGELGLDGTVRPVPGVLSCADLAMSMGLRGCIFPRSSAMEAADFKEMEIYGVNTLDDVVKILSDGEDCSELLIWNDVEWNRIVRARHRHSSSDSENVMDFADIIGQEGAKRGMEIAAAGGHNIIMLGPPGAGKSSLAKAISGILPPMTHEESVITTKIYSVAGLSGNLSGMIRNRPFRSPHYSISLSAMIGGGSGNNITPGEVTLSQGGVLFLDEFNQMPKSIIEALRGPLEDRKVIVSRLRSKIEYPASFMLVAASNPCPCGYYGEKDKCVCTPSQRVAYLSKLSGPILDRIDIHLWLHPVPTDKIMEGRKAAESSEEVAKRVLSARITQKNRFLGEGIHTNSEMNNRQIDKYCPLSDSSKSAIEKIMKNMQMSMRAYYRTIKVARTIADLDGSEDIKASHIMEAASYRFLDKQNLGF